LSKKLLYNKDTVAFVRIRNLREYTFFVESNYGKIRHSKI